MVEVVTVHRLPDQRHFLATLIDEDATFLNDVIRVSRLFGASRGWHDAVRAKLIAADLNADERLIRRRPHFGIASGIEALEARLDFFPRRVFSAEADGELRLAGFANGLDERRNLSELARADDEIDERNSFANQGLIFLGHAADHADDEFGPSFLFRANSAERGEGLLLGMFANGTGVKENHVGVVGIVREDVPLTFERADDDLGIEDVHLTPNGVDKDFAYDHDRDTGVHAGPMNYGGLLYGVEISFGILIDFTLS